MSATTDQNVPGDEPALLQNASVKGEARRKTAPKPRKARPLKNVQLDVLKVRLSDIQKRLRTAECKMTLLREKLVLHEEEVTFRNDSAAAVTPAAEA